MTPARRLPALSLSLAFLLPAVAAAQSAPAGAASAGTGAREVTVTLTAFEVTTTHLGAQNAVGAGGRYNGLVETLGGPKTPAVGFAVGLERIVLALPEKAVPALEKLVYVAGFGGQGRSAGLRLLYELRTLGVRADSDFKATSLKAHMKQVIIEALLELKND